MKKETVELARSTTWAGSKQTYFTARLLVDRDLVDDFYRAYAYFRWADDVIDESEGSADDRNAFIRRQRELIDGFYRGEQQSDLSPQEKILADLISDERDEKSGLESFIRNMFAIIEFDVYRKGWQIDEEELAWYTHTLSISVTDGIHYFIGSGRPRPESPYQYSAAEGAHIAHLLRDAVVDTADGYINIPAEYLEKNNISPGDFESERYRSYVEERVALARRFFEEGKLYLNDLRVLRTKIAGYWYSARFEGVLDTIEGDGYILREKYNERSRIRTWLKIGWLGVTVISKHYFQRRQRSAHSVAKQGSHVLDANVRKE